MCQWKWKSLSRVWLFVILWTVAWQAPLSVGILQARILESGLSCLLPGDLPNPGIKPRSSTLWADSLPSEIPGNPKNTGVGSLSLLLGDLPDPGIELRFPVLQADSLLAEPQGKPKSTGVGSLSLLQWIFLTQESNWGFLHCKWILNQLSYQGLASCKLP